MNRVFVAGHLAMDPLVRTCTHNDRQIPYAIFLLIPLISLWRDQDGKDKQLHHHTSHTSSHSSEEQTQNTSSEEGSQHTRYRHKVLIFRQSLVDFASRAITKGRGVIVDGRLHYRRHTVDTGTIQSCSIVIGHGYGSVTVLPASHNTSQKEASSEDNEEKSCGLWA